jgi:hypothetical protein
MPASSDAHRAVGEVFMVDADVLRTTRSELPLQELRIGEQREDPIDIAVEVMRHLHVSHGQEP